MKVKFDFDLDLDIRGLEIEGKDLEDCKNKLYSMFARDILAEDDVVIQNEHIGDVDIEIIEKEKKYHLSNIKWDVEDSNTELPTELDITLTLESKYGDEETIKDYLELNYLESVDSFDYEEMSE